MGGSHFADKRKIERRGDGEYLVAMLIFRGLEGVHSPRTTTMSPPVFPPPAFTIPTIGQCVCAISLSGQTGGFAPFRENFDPLN